LGIYLMITTVALNAAIDKTYYVPDFQLGTVYRVPQVIVDAGGKGINVAKVVRLLGEPCLTTGFVGGHNGTFIEEDCARRGIEHDFIHVEGESRLCLNIMDGRTGTSTELLEPGHVVPRQAVEQLKSKITELAKRSRILCLSGSIPAGVPIRIYADLTLLAKAEGCRVLLDTSGEALLHGIEAGPDFIKPNEDECRELTGKEAHSVEELMENLEPLRHKGIGCIVVSLGSNGALSLAQGNWYRIRVPHIEAVNAVGSGDSFVAGYAIGLSQGDSTESCLKLAAAAGTANVRQARAGHVDAEDVKKIMAEVQVERL
jgi:tagatose 6-phosphate kinase